MSFPENLGSLNKYLEIQSEKLQQHFGLAQIQVYKATKFSVGQSNPTFLLETSQNLKLVLRKKPNGKLLPGAHQIEREYFITSKLSLINFPVAKPILLCESSEVVGAPFYLMEYVEGRIFTDAKLLNLQPEEKKQIYFEIIRVLAMLHNIDIESSGLSQLGKADNFYQRQISLWSRQYKLAETNLKTQMEDLMLWLQLNIPKEDKFDKVCFCHGDFSITNIIFHPIENRIVAILDWELASIGKSKADLGYFTMIYHTYPYEGPHSGGIKGINPLYLGIPSLENLIQAYYQNLGIVISEIPDISFQNIFSMFRLSSIGQGVYKRALEGNASQKEQGLTMGQLSQKLAQDAWDFVKLRTNNDPFQIRQKLEMDASLWGQWEISDRCKYYYYAVKQFMIKEIFPIEKGLFEELQKRSQDNRWQPIQKIEELKKQAQALGLWNLFCTYPVYGRGLTNLEYSCICELMGMSFFAPEVFNCSAPDTGNMELLILYANENQKRKYLVPLLNGTIRSAFAMTEPAVASSDATNIKSSLKNNILNGKKWYISGAGDPRCKFSIVMCKDEGSETKKPYRQQSMVIVDLPHPQVNITRPMGVFGYDDAPHGHMEMEFNNVYIPPENIIWEQGRGFEIAQGRLGGGRLHHCMRLVGLGKRVIDLMIQRGQTRTLFAKEMWKTETFQQELGQLSMKLQAARLLVLNAASQLDQFGNKKSQTLKALSICKAYVPQVVCDIVDSVIQIFGAEGISQDQILAYAYAQARTLRIADGPDTVHIRQVAKYTLHQHNQEDLPKKNGYGLAKF